MLTEEAKRQMAEAKAKRRTADEWLQSTKPTAQPLVLGCIVAGKYDNAGEDSDPYSGMVVDEGGVDENGSPWVVVAIEKTRTLRGKGSTQFPDAVLRRVPIDELDPARTMLPHFGSVYRMAGLLAGTFWTRLYHGGYPGEFEFQLLVYCGALCEAAQQLRVAA